MGIGVLGPITVDERATTLSPRDRVVLAALAVRPGEVVSLDQLADVLWGDDVPASATKVLQGCVSRLRKVLGNRAIETVPAGYRLTVPSDEIDARRFERAVTRARHLIDGGDPERAEHVLVDALGMWRGRPLEDVDGWDQARIEVVRLEELRNLAEELKVEAGLASGHHEQVLAAARVLVGEQPLRERRWVLLATALYQSGRQGEALNTLRRLRSVLGRELGIDPSPEVEELEGAILRQDPALLPVPGAPEASRICPYRGLLPYDVDDSDEFFGREADVEACLRRLSVSPVLVVVGPSGSGKSSLVRAGVAAALRRDGDLVDVVTPGPHAMAAIEAVGARHRTATLVVDQCEELFTICVDPEERRRFFDALVARGKTARLVVSLRADRLADLSGYPDFARLAEPGTYLLGPLSEDDLRAAITGPARLAALTVEPGLVDLLVAEVSGQPGALPLMSHALRETWKRREGRTLTADGYRDSGGIRGAVAKSAEQVYAAVPPEQQQMLRDLLMRLVFPGPVGEPVRSRLPRRVVVTDPEHERMVDLLVTSRLVTSDGDAVEIAHEALARAWPRLRDWLDDDIEGQRIMHHLAGAADAWQSLDRPDSELYRGVRLARALDWRERTTHALSATEREFLEASKRLSEAELHAAEERARITTRSNRRLRALLAVAAVLVLVATVATTYAVRQTGAARDAAAASDRAALLADARRVGARAQLSEDVTLSLALAATGARLAGVPETRANLLAAADRTPRLVRSAPGGGGYVDIPDVSPDGRWIASGDDAGRMHLYDAATGRLLRSHSTGPVEKGTHVSLIPAFSPDGRILAVARGAESDAPFRVIDPATMRPSDVMLAPIGRSVVGVDVAFSDDGRYLAGTFHDPPRAGEAPFEKPAFAAVWDLRSPGKTPQVVRSGLGNQGVALSPEGRIVYTSWPLTAYDLDADRLLWRRDDLLSFVSLDLDPSGTVLGLEFHDFVRDDTQRLVDARTGRVLQRLAGHDDQARDMRFSNDGRSFATASHDGEVIVWDVTTGEPLDRWRTYEQNWGVAFSRDDSQVYTAGDDGMLRTWDLALKDTVVTRVSDVPGDYVHADVAPDGSRVALRWLEEDTGWARFVDPATGESTPARRLPGYAGPWSPGVWRPDGTEYLSYGCNGGPPPADCPGQGTILAVDPGSGTVVRRRHVVDADIWALGFTDGGRRIVIGDSRDRTLVLGATTLRPLDRWGMKASCCLTPVQDGARLMMYEDSPDGASEHWRLVDSGSGRVLQQGDLALRAHASTAAPDGRRVAVAGETGEVVVIDTRTGRQRQSSTGLDAQILWLRYSDDGRRLVSGADDGGVSLWDARTVELLGTVHPPQNGGPVPVGADFAGGTHDVVIASYDGQLFRWDTELDRTVDTVCRMAGRGLTREEWATYLPEQPYRHVCRPVVSASVRRSDVTP